MKKILALLYFFVLPALFFSCANENPTNPGGGGTPGSFQGEWTVDKVQMVQAPPGGSGASMMKQALVIFGEVSGSFAGFMDLKFGAETMISTPTNLTEGESYFIGNVGYYITQKSSSTDALLYVSMNGGNSWSQINFQRKYSLFSLNVYNESTIFVMGAYGTQVELIKSTDYGTTWTTINNKLNVRAYSSFINEAFCFQSETVGYAIDNFIGEMKLYKTTDGGQNWNITHTFPSSSVERMRFFSESTGIIQGYAGGTKVIRKTTNGGMNWRDSPVPTATSNSFFLNENQIWVWGRTFDPPTYTYYVYKSNDGGQSWQLLTDKMPISQLKFSNANTGYAVGLDDFLLKTNNGGLNWSVYSTPSRQTVYGYNLFKLQLFNEQPVFYAYEKFWKPSGIIDTAKWTVTGMVTNPAVRLWIPKSPNYAMFANGDFSINSNTITFNVSNYSESVNKTGTGTFSFENGFLNLELNLPNNEKWKIIFRRK